MHAASLDGSSWLCRSWSWLNTEGVRAMHDQAAVNLLAQRGEAPPQQQRRHETLSAPARTHRTEGARAPATQELRTLKLRSTKRHAKLVRHRLHTQAAGEIRSAVRQVCTMLADTSDARCLDSKTKRPIPARHSVCYVHGSCIVSEAPSRAVGLAPPH